jgi:hypothetical protein
LRLGEKQILHLPRPSRPGKTPKAFLSQRRKDAKLAKEIQRQLHECSPASSPDLAKFHGLSTPAQAGALGFADDALTSSPGYTAWEDVVFVSRKDAKLAKESQRRKDVRSSSLASSQRPDNSKFPESRRAAKKPQIFIPFFQPVA